MNKKLLAMLLISGSLFSENNCTSKTGYHLGILGNYQVVHGEVKNNNPDNRNTLRPAGFKPGLFIGYDMKVGDFYTGINANALFGDIHDRSIVNNVNAGVKTSTKVEYKLHSLFGIDYNFGYCISKNLVGYGILSWSTQEGLFRTVNQIKGETIYKKRHNHHFFNLGFGFKTGLTENFFLKTEYKWGTANSKNYGEDNKENKLKIKNDTHNFNLGLGYTF